jgi:hypothetical protein
MENLRGCESEVTLFQPIGHAPYPDESEGNSAPPRDFSNENYNFTDHLISHNNNYAYHLDVQIPIPSTS